MRRWPLLLALISLPAAGGGTVTVCSGDSTTSTGGTMLASSCDYAQIGPALASQPAVVQVYRPDSGAAYAPFAVSHSVSLVGIPNGEGAVPEVASTTNIIGVDVDCTGCTVGIDDMVLSSVVQPALEVSGATVLLTRVKVDAISQATSPEYAVRLYSGELEATGGGMDSVSQAIFVNGANARWLDGQFTSQQGAVALVDNGSLELSGGTVYAPGSLNGLQVQGTGTLLLTNFIRVYGHSEDTQLQRTAGSLVRIGSGGSFFCVDAGIEGASSDQGALVEAVTAATGTADFLRCTLKDAVAANDGALLHAQDFPSVSSAGSVWQNGRGANGGAVKLINVGSASFTGDWFDQNQATGTATNAGHGGAIGSIGTALELVDVEFSLNTAVHEGGAVYAGTGGSLSITGGNFRDGHAENGGAVYSQGVWVDVNGTGFTGNSADFEGGALGGDAWAVWQVADATFRLNTSENDGGAMAFAPHASGWLVRSFFCDNQATDDGGALYAFLGGNAGPQPLGNNVFFRNTAFSQGGAIYADGASLLADYTTFASNEAEAGGALFAAFGGGLGVTNSLLALTTAGDGARVDADSATALSLAGYAWANQPQTAGTGVANSMVELGADPFVALDTSADCNAVSWAVGDEGLGGATEGTDPFLPDSSVDWDGDGLSADDGDCDDTNADVHPGATETCDELDTDEDCNGLADDADAGNVRGGMSTFYADDDGDGYTGSRTVNRCDPTAIYLAEPTELDCDDANLAIHPGADEVCDPLGVDEDCDELVNEADDSLVDGTYYFEDADGDGFGAGEGIFGCGNGSGLVDNDNDCDDTNAAVNPIAVEDYTTPIDEDCDGNCCDEDNDSYPHEDAAGPDELGDCNDTDPSIFPGATEIPGDGVNQNCIGEDGVSAVGSGSCGCRVGGGAAMGWLLLPALAGLRRRR